MSNESSPLLSDSENRHLEQKIGESLAGERLPYSHYASIDWLHELVKDSYRSRNVRLRPGIRGKINVIWDSASGWIAAALIGILTACVAYVVDISVSVISDWKFGYCVESIFYNREVCCRNDKNDSGSDFQTSCAAFHPWSDGELSRAVAYIGLAVCFGIVSCGLTMLTKRTFASASLPDTKTIYMAAGSGIPEIKTVLSGFVIPHLLGADVLLVKAVGAMFAVPAGLCLGKEGPFVHISACVGWLVANAWPKFRDNGRELRYMLSVACSSGLGVAFGAPIGGVLFSFEEISTYFPRSVLLRAFLCSLLAAITLKSLDPTGTGRLVLFETNFVRYYQSLEYIGFLSLGIVGGIFGGCFCKANFLWSRWFRSFSIVRDWPVVEVLLITAITGIVQYPNPLTRVLGETTIRELLVDCRGGAGDTSWICQRERDSGHDHTYLWLLVHGTVAKLILTIITFGIKVPSGVIIPALSAGALFGRLFGNLTRSDIPGSFALVGSAAFLAGVSRMTISLCVIMFELTGEVEYVIPSMLSIFVAKFVADAISHEGVYDLAQTLLGHPFLDLDRSMDLLKQQPEGVLAKVLIPPEQTMNEIKVTVSVGNCVPRYILEEKLGKLRARGLTDAGLVLLQENTNVVLGYISQDELAFGLEQSPCPDQSANPLVRLFGVALESFEPSTGCLSSFVDRTPICICENAPVEYAIELFGKLGLRYLIIVEEKTGSVVGVVIKRRVLAYLDSL